MKVCTGLLLCAIVAIASGQTVQVGNLGSVKGQQVASYASPGKMISTFWGIPFAKPPVGELRFKKPVEIDTIGDHDGTVPGPGCYQSNGNPAAFSMMEYQSEDCLRLNIYAPDVTKEENKNKKFPVMVWFHGSGFSFDWAGNPLYYGQELARWDVVVVTANYRLGTLGYLSTGDHHAIGNYGLWDNIYALKWVKKYISYFNGDPDLVTAFGESAGAASVSLLLVSPPAAGLFHRGISESGGSIALWTVNTDPYKYTQRLAVIAGCPSEPWEKVEMMECFRQLTPTQLRTYEGKVQDDDILITWTPVVDGPDGALPEAPIDVLNSGNYYKVPFITGGNKDEGVALFGYCDMSGGDIIQDPEKFETELIPKCMKKLHMEDPDGILSAAAAQEYTYWERHGQPLSAYMSSVEMLTDAGIFMSMDYELRKHVAASHYRVYEYVWDYVTEASPLGPFVPHAMEVIYIFGLAYRPVYMMCISADLCFSPMAFMNERDQAFTDHVQKMWTDFARTGSPTPGRSRINNFLLWDKFTEENREYLSINWPSEVKTRVHAKRMQMWQDLAPRLGQTFYPNGTFMKPVPTEPWTYPPPTLEPTVYDDEISSTFWALFGLTVGLACATIIQTYLFMKAMKPIKKLQARSP